MVSKNTIKTKSGLRINDISFRRNEDRETKSISLPYSNYANGCEKMFKPLGIKVAYKTKKIIRNPKDRNESFQMSGIYGIYCKDCFKKYNSQSRTAIHTR